MVHVSRNSLGFCFIRSPYDRFHFIMREDIRNKRTVFEPFMLWEDICVIPQAVARDMHHSLPVIFRILYGCGLRVSEVLKLQYRDVNLDDGILTIREAKTDRDRLIPLSDSVKAACVSYAENIWWERDTDLFFPAPDRTMISPMTIYQRFRRYLRKAGISHGGKGNGPRLHDIRYPNLNKITHGKPL